MVLNAAGKEAIISQLEAVEVTLSGLPQAEALRQKAAGLAPTLEKLEELRFAPLPTSDQIALQQYREDPDQEPAVLASCNALINAAKNSLRAGHEAHFENNALHLLDLIKKLFTTPARNTKENVSKQHEIRELLKYFAKFNANAQHQFEAVRIALQSLKTYRVYKLIAAADALVAKTKQMPAYKTNSTRFDQHRTEFIAAIYDFFDNPPQSVADLHRFINLSAFVAEFSALNSEGSSRNRLENEIAAYQEALQRLTLAFPFLRAYEPAYALTKQVPDRPLISLGAVPPEELEAAGMPAVREIADRAVVTESLKKLQEAVPEEQRPPYLEDLIAQANQLLSTLPNSIPEYRMLIEVALIDTIRVFLAKLIVSTSLADMLETEFPQKVLQLAQELITRKQTFSLPNTNELMQVAQQLAFFLTTFRLPAHLEQGVSGDELANTDKIIAIMRQLVAVLSGENIATKEKAPPRTPPNAPQIKRAPEFSPIRRRVSTAGEGDAIQTIVHEAEGSEGSESPRALSDAEVSDASSDGSDGEESDQAYHQQQLNNGEVINQRLEFLSSNLVAHEQNLKALEQQLFLLPPEKVEATIVNYQRILNFVYDESSIRKALQEYLPQKLDIYGLNKTTQKLFDRAVLHLVVKVKILANHLKLIELTFRNRETPTTHLQAQLQRLTTNADVSDEEFKDTELRVESLVDSTATYQLIVNDAKGLVEQRRKNLQSAFSNLQTIFGYLRTGDYDRAKREFERETNTIQLDDDSIIARLKGMYPSSPLVVDSKNVQAILCDGLAQIRQENRQTYILHNVIPEVLRIIEETLESVQRSLGKASVNTLTPHEANQKVIDHFLEKNKQEIMDELIAQIAGLQLDDHKQQQVVSDIFQGIEKEAVALGAKAADKIVSELIANIPNDPDEVMRKDGTLGPSTAVQLRLATSQSAVAPLNDEEAAAALASLKARAAQVSLEDEKDALERQQAEEETRQFADASQHFIVETIRAVSIAYKEYKRSLWSGTISQARQDALTLLLNRLAGDSCKKNIGVFAALDRAIDSLQAETAPHSGGNLLLSCFNPSGNELVNQLRRIRQKLQSQPTFQIDARGTPVQVAPPLLPPGFNNVGSATLYPLPGAVEFIEPTPTQLAVLKATQQLVEAESTYKNPGAVMALPYLYQAVKDSTPENIATIEQNLSLIIQAMGLVHAVEKDYNATLAPHDSRRKDSIHDLYVLLARAYKDNHGVPLTPTACREKILEIFTEISGYINQEHKASGSLRSKTEGILPEFFQTKSRLATRLDKAKDSFNITSELVLAPAEQARLKATRRLDAVEGTYNNNAGATIAMQSLRDALTTAGGNIEAIEKNQDLIIKAMDYIRRVEKNYLDSFVVRSPSEDRLNAIHNLYVSLSSAGTGANGAPLALADCRNNILQIFQDQAMATETQHKAWGAIRSKTEGILPNFLQPTSHLVTLINGAREELEHDTRPRTGQQAQQTL